MWHFFRLSMLRARGGITKNLSHLSRWKSDAPTRLTGVCLARLDSIAEVKLPPLAHQPGTRLAESQTGRQCQTGSLMKITRLPFAYWKNPFVHWKMNRDWAGVGCADRRS
jgi:hypothetical protein